MSSGLSKFTQEELDIKLNFSQQPTEVSSDHDILTVKKAISGLGISALQKKRS